MYIQRFRIFPPHNPHLKSIMFLCNRRFLSCATAPWSKDRGCKLVRPPLLLIRERCDLVLVPEGPCCNESSSPSSASSSPATTIIIAHYQTPRERGLQAMSFVPWRSTRQPPITEPVRGKTKERQLTRCGAAGREGYSAVRFVYTEPGCDTRRARHAQGKRPSAGRVGRVGLVGLVSDLSDLCRTCRTYRIGLKSDL